MSQNLKITWIRDNTIRVQAVITNFNGSLLNSTSNAIVVYDPVGTNMGTVTSAHAGTGTYTANYSVPSAEPRASGRSAGKYWREHGLAEKLSTSMLRRAKKWLIIVLLLPLSSLVK